MSFRSHWWPQLRWIRGVVLIGGSLATAVALCLVTWGTRRALTRGDALLRIPDVSGHVVSVGDADGDGIADLVMERGGVRPDSERIDLVSARTGALIRTLWQRDDVLGGPTAWTAGN